ncbi:MAG: hypothetical protein IPN01_35135 [Deltaproteobacteria bacterium]|nr:hypothetical protein [Deltaproteobacteria bacterium]
MPRPSPLQLLRRALGRVRPAPKACAPACANATFALRPGEARGLVSR